MVHRFLFLYPFVMSIVWMVGGCVYAWRRERHPSPESPDLPETPFVSILVPCHNEGDVLEGTIGRMLQLDYPAYEIVALDDGSTDDTRAVMWVPERLRSLIRQRARWAQGGVEVLIRNASVLWTWKNRRMIPLYVEEVLGIAWAYLWVVSLV